MLRRLTSFFLMLIVLSMPQYGSATGGGGTTTKKKDEPPVDVCRTVEVSEKDVSIRFPSTYTGRTASTIPEPGSDPSVVTGGTSLYNSGGTYYCVVTVVGVRCTEYSKSYTWNVKSRTMKIPIPQNIDFTLAVEFYERCGNWDNANTYARPFYVYSKYFTGSQAIFDIPLVYTRTEAC